MSDDFDHSSFRDEFLAEAHEIVEALARDLLVLDHEESKGNEAALINELFRGVHTLKGMAGMFGFAEAGKIAHNLEDKLDDLRLGRVELTRDLLDEIFDGVERLQTTLFSEEAQPSESPEPRITDAPPERISVRTPAPAAIHPGPRALDLYALEPSVLAVLTGYEEHRLEYCVKQGYGLYWITTRPRLDQIDTALEKLREALNNAAEIITYLPSIDETAPDSVQLRILCAWYGSTADMDLQGLSDATVEPVPPVRRVSLSPGARSSMGALRTGPSLEDLARVRSNPPEAEEPHHDELLVPDTNPPPPRRRVTAAGRPAPVVQPDVVARTVRVDIRKLDVLMNNLGELSLVRTALDSLTAKLRALPELRTLALEFAQAEAAFTRQLSALQTGILGVRMVPLSQLFDRLARGVRQASRDRDKKVRFVVTGGRTEVDKVIVEELVDPFMHIVRNCVDHGIERPQVRTMTGKAEEGTVAINAFQKGNHVMIELQDDGAGINPIRLGRAAIRKGLLSEEEVALMDDEELRNLVFMPGLSTASTITDMSGRGVGMDVVKTNVSRLGGVIDLESEVGTGTKFTITLPITLAIVRSLVLEVDQELYTIPLTAVQEVLQISKHRVVLVDGRHVISLRGVTIPVCGLREILRLPGESTPRTGGEVATIVVRVGNRSVGLLVDRVTGQQDVVIKALGRSLSAVRGFAGATDLGGNRLALVLDAPGIVEEILQRPPPRLAGVA